MKPPARQTKARTEEIKREGILATHVRACSGPFNAGSLAKSYALPLDRVQQIISRNGGSCG
jgi:hypothetical protein